MATNRRVEAWSGWYDRQVVICKNVPTVNSDGQEVEGETEYCRRWVRITPIRGRERFIAQQAQSDVTHRVRMRYDSETKLIEPTFWIKKLDGTRLDIRTVIDVDDAHMEIELECNRRS